MTSTAELRLSRHTLPEVAPFLRIVDAGPDGRGKLVSGSGEPLRVMVVEDDAMVSAVFRDIIEASGGEVIATVTSGLASVGAADGTRPDIIIMDIGLPGMDGIDAAGIIRSRYSIPIVFVSGLDVRDELAQRLGESDGIELLVKPIDPDSLLQALLKAYGSARRR